MIFSKTKTIKNTQKNVVIFLLCLVFFSLYSFTKIQAARQMEGVAFVTDKTGQMINGDYTVRFAIYSTDRTTIDTYPSDGDRDTRVWEETQTVTIKNGVLNFNLGQNQELPILDNSQGTHYFLGIRINQDSELIPRKRITSSLFAYNATNASLLNGKKIGTGSGDILSLNATGKIDIQNLPIGTGAGQLITGNDSRLNDSLTLSGAKYLTLSNQKLTANKIKFSTDTQGTLPVNQGGTGLTTNPENGKVLMGNGSGYAFGSILGAGNVNVATTSSNISISLKDIISVGSLAISGTVPTDTANHLYKNGDNLYWGETNLSSGGTTYTTSGSLLQLTGTTFSIKEGTLTNNKICTYSTTNGLVCDTDPASAGVETDPAFSDSPAFGITDGNIVSWNAKENALTFSTGLNRVGNTITNTDLGSNQNIFKTIAVSGQSNIVANQNNATLTLAAGANITLTTNPGTNTVTASATDTNTTYSKSGTLLQLTGTAFSMREGTLTDTRLCTYSTTSGLVCDTSTSSVGHTAATINPTPNGLTINGSQQISLALSTTSTTGALSSTDWNIFNNKQPAGTYLTGTKVDSFNTRTGAVTLSSSDVTTALTFTPYNATNPSNYLSTIDISTNTNLATSGTLLRLTGDTLSIKEGTLTSGRLCSYDGTNLVCDTSSASVGHTAATINVTPNGLTINGSQEISLALASTSTTGALSNTDWNIFNNKQPAGYYLTSFTEVDPRLPAIGASGNLLQSNGTAWSSWTPNYLSANQTITLSGRRHRFRYNFNCHYDWSRQNHRKYA